MISIVIRTRNEGAWLRRCLEAVRQQDYPDFEVIVVDNDSSDGTVEEMESLGHRLLKISEEEFSHGRSINRGIHLARGELVAVLSGHCIPLNDKWLFRLALNFKNPRVAGVYGRQEPLPDTSDFDKRDLWTTFGLDRRIQRQDYLFHNANSMIRREVWEKVPFNENLSGVEDRDWAKRVLERGYQIVYDPVAGVYHFHGIHHGPDGERARRVARVIELIQEGAVEQLARDS